MAAPGLDVPCGVAFAFRVGAQATCASTTVPEFYASNAAAIGQRMHRLAGGGGGPGGPPGACEYPQSEAIH